MDSIKHAIRLSAWYSCSLKLPLAVPPSGEGDRAKDLHRGGDKEDGDKIAAVAVKERPGDHLRRCAGHDADACCDARDQGGGFDRDVLHAHTVTRNVEGVQCKSADEDSLASVISERRAAACECQ